METELVKNIVVDMDGVLVDWDFEGWVKLGMPFGTFGKVIKGARKAMYELKAMGYTIIIHTCRVTTEYYTRYNKTELEARTVVEGWLRENAIPFDLIWTKTGKPIADYYIDDLAIKFESWEQVLKEIK